MHIRRVRQTEDDAAAIWRIIEPIVRAGDTHALPSGMTRADALAYWLAPVHEVFVAEDESGLVGTYYLRANQQGGRRPCRQLRLHDRAVGRRAGRGPRHVRPFARPRPRPQVPRHAI